MNQKKRKKPYQPPRVSLTIVEIESSIAAGSATFRPGDANDVIYEEWEVEQNDTGFDW